MVEVTLNTSVRGRTGAKRVQDANPDLQLNDEVEAITLERIPEPQLGCTAVSFVAEQGAATMYGILLCSAAYIICNVLRLSPLQLDLVAFHILHLSIFDPSSNLRCNHQPHPCVAGCGP